MPLKDVVSCKLQKPLNKPRLRAGFFISPYHMRNVITSLFARLLYAQDFGGWSFLSSNRNSLNWEKKKRYFEKYTAQQSPITKMNKSIINYDQIFALSNQNMELAKKLLEAFLHELEPVVNTFKPNPTDEDMEAISKLTHKIKPSLQLLELDVLNQKMNVYKMKYREGTAASRAELPALYREIIQIYKDIVEEIRNYISGMVD